MQRKIFFTTILVLFVSAFAVTGLTVFSDTVAVKGAAATSSAPIKTGPDFTDVIVVFNEHSRVTAGGIMADGAVIGDLQAKGLLILERYPAINAAHVRLPSSALAALQTTGFIDRIEPNEAKFHILLNESIPLIKANITQDMGYNGTGIDVCVLDTGLDRWHKNITVPTQARDFTNYDWCIDGAQNTAGTNRQYNFSLNISNASLGWLEIGSYWGSGSNRFDLFIYNASGSHLGNTSANSVSTFSGSSTGGTYRYVKVNVTISGTGLYTILVNETTSGATNDYPTVVWGGNATNLMDQYWDSNYYWGSSAPCLGGSASSLGNKNPALAGEDRAFPNIEWADDNGHGSHVAGTIAGNSSTYKGVAPGANLYVGKVLGGGLGGAGFTSEINAGIQWCIDSGADVISMSLGGTAPANCNGSDDNLIDAAAAQGILPVIAVGNSGPSSSTIGSPGCARMALGVGATNKTDVIASFSSRGPTGYGGLKPEVTGPGVDIYAPFITNRYESLDGTSMATPHVAGAAAALKQAQPSWTAPFLKAALINSANMSKVASPDYNYGAGRIDLLAAINSTNVTNNTITTGQNRTYTVDLQSGVSELRGTLYWEENSTDTHSNISFYLMNQSGAVISSATTANWTVQVVNRSSPAAGQWSVRVAGVSVASSETFYLASNVPLDNNPPNITVQSPGNTIYTQTWIWANVTLNKIGSWCGVSLNGTSNQTLTNSSGNWNFNLSVPSEGSNHVRFFCNDTGGNMGNSSLLFFSINTSLPLMESPGSNANYSTTSIWFNATAAPDTDWCGFSLNSTANVTMANDSAQHWYNQSTVAEGSHNVTVFCNNTGSVMSTSGLRTFRVDLTAPTVSINAPSAQYYRANITVNATATDALTYVSAVQWRYENTSTNGTWTAMSQSGNFWTGTFVSTGVADGNYTVRINATDNVGNSNTSVSIVNVSVDNTAPAVALAGYTNATNLKNTLNLTLNISVTDTGSGLGANNCSVSIGGGSGQTITQSGGWCNGTVSLTGLAEGNKSIAASINDSVGNTGTNSSFVVQIDNTAPTILNITVVNITNTSAFVQWYTNEDANTGMVYGTNSTNLTSSVAINNTNSTFHRVNLTGLTPATSYMYRANSTDTAGNTVTDSVRWFTTANTVEQTINASNATNVSFNATINGTAQTVANITINTNTTVNATISLAVMTDNPTGANISTPAIVPRYVVIDTNNTLNSSVLSWVIITVYYNDSDLPSGTAESSLRLYRYNETSGNWTELSGGVDTSANYVWGNSTLLSNFGIGGLLADGQTCSVASQCAGGYCCSGSCASSTCPTGGGGGGGGGGGLPPSRTRVTVERGKATISVPSIAAAHMANVSIEKTDDMAVREIVISVKNAVNNIQLVIEKLAGRPADVTLDITGKVYHYIKVDKENVTDDDVDNATIKFAVDDSWLTTNNVDAANIRLNRWSGTAWDLLPTTGLGRADNEYFFSAVSPGLSYFAITGQDVGAVPAACTESWSCTDWSACTDGQQTRTCTDANACGTTVDKPSESQACGAPAMPGAAPSAGWLAAVVVVIIAIAALAFWRMRSQ